MRHERMLNANVFSNCLGSLVQLKQHRIEKTARKKLFVGRVHWYRLLLLEFLVGLLPRLGLGPQQNEMDRMAGFLLNKHSDDLNV